MVANPHAIKQESRELKFSYMLNMLKHFFFFFSQETFSSFTVGD